MSEEDADRITKRVRYVSGLVAAYVTRNYVPPPHLPALIATLADALDAMAVPHAPKVSEPVVKPTEDEIRSSIQRDRLISFIDGRPYKSLGRHLRYKGFSPQSYRTIYGLPVDYPMVAPSYSRRRSEISKAIIVRHMQRKRGAP